MLKFKDFKLGQDTLTTDTLQAGQVWYVWTGNKKGDEADLSGTSVMARNGKKIAIFQGCPHTNIPLGVRDRDQIYSQAMPNQYWGNTFVITSSMTRKRDKIRIMALYDGTEVRVNDSLVHTFDFSTNLKRTFEFEIGDLNVSCTDKNSDLGAVKLPAPLVVGTSCVVKTSCPASAHLFMVSNKYDDTPDGDPAMLWINPIEQVIDRITFSTFNGSGNTHYFNVVTDSANVKTMTLDGASISTDFAPVNGDSAYWFARKNIPHGTHTLQGKNGFIAHVYGYGDKESYAYSAGGATKALTQSIEINGEIFTADSDNQLCGLDKVTFECTLDFEPESITWGFGDGTPNETGSYVEHNYEEDGIYQAYCIIERTSSNLCAGQTARDSIPIKVIIGTITFTVDSVSDRLCAEDDDFYVWYSASAEFDLDSCKISFNQTALDNGFVNENLVVTEEYFKMDIPDNAGRGADYKYGVDLSINTDCGAIDTTLYFIISPEAESLVEQRWDDILAVKVDPNVIYTEFQWYKNDVPIENATTSVLNLNGETDFENAYSICFTYTEKATGDTISTCSCPMHFKPQNKGDILEFGTDIWVSSFTLTVGNSLYVTSPTAATVEWINVSGDIIRTETIPAGGANVFSPAERGLYILRVTTDEEERNFKILVLE